METDARKQRQQFYRDYVSGQWSMSELCERYEISRPTGYKWIGRIERDGIKARCKPCPLTSVNHLPNRSASAALTWLVRSTLSAGGRAYQHMSQTSSPADIV